jgi:hypothetical protein
MRPIYRLIVTTLLLGNGTEAPAIDFPPNTEWKLSNLHLVDLISNGYSLIAASDLIQGTRDAEFFLQKGASVFRCAESYVKGPDVDYVYTFTCYQLVQPYHDPQQRDPARTGSDTRGK